MEDTNNILQKKWFKFLMKWEEEKRMKVEFQPKIELKREKENNKFDYSFLYLVYLILLS